MRRDHSHRADWRLYLGVWGFAATIRLAYLVVAQPAFTIYYWEAASSLFQDGSFSFDGVKTAAVEPFYPLFLAATRSLVGDRPLLVQAVQALVASAGAIYLYKLAHALTAKMRVGIAAGALFAVYPLLVRHSIDGTESALLTTLLIAFAHRFVTIATAIDAAAAGAWLGLAILTRIVALPLLVIAPLLAAPKGRRIAPTLAGVALLLLAPYAIRNYALNGAIVPSRGGINLFIANNAYAPAVVADYGPDILLPYAESRLAGEGLADLPPTPDAERQRDTAYRRLAFAEIRSHPLDTSLLKIQNVATFFSPVLVPRRIATETTDIRLGEEGTAVVENSVSRPLSEHLIYSLSYGIVLALAAVGVWYRRRDLARDAILWCTLLAFAAVHAVFFPSTRYRAPVDFVFLFYAGVAVDTLIDAWRRLNRASHQRSSATAA